MDIMMEHMGHGIGLILLLSLPAVLLAAGIGLIVGILQAVTQVQEQTIAAAPKIVFVFLLIMLGGPFMMDALKEYLYESIRLGMEVIPQSEPMLLPPKPRLAYGEGESKEEFFKEHHRYPTDSKVKAMMNQPSPMNGINADDHNMSVSTRKPHPKPGIGEQIFLHRRAQGTLPHPPKIQ